MSHAPTAALRRRHGLVRDDLERRGVGALIVTSLPNIEYLSNFAGSTAIAVLTRERLHFFTDSRYTAACAETRGTAHECPDFELHTVEGSYDVSLSEFVIGQDLGRAGFEAAHLTVSRHTWLLAAFERAGRALELIPTEDVVERCRIVKDAYELSTLREAGRRLATVAESIVDEIHAGLTEREVAMAIDWRIRSAGFARTAFDTIVASGPNAALPHARPGERKLTEGDLVVLDFGGVYDSYCVDLTRTVSVGTAGSRAREVYDAVRQAQARAIEAVRPGQSRFEIDAAARNTLDSHGFGAAFGHGTGHGLGLEVHETPRIARRRPDVDTRDEAVAPGMVFTIEPGAYFPGWGGVRIEDDVVVTEDGVEVLTGGATGLIEIRD